MSEKSRQKKYSWNYIDKACANIAKQWQWKIPRIVGISRGGLIPATLIAKHLGASEVYSVGLKSYSDDSAYATRKPKPDVYQDIQYNCPRLSRGEPVLLVDDISDMGNTLEYVCANMFEGSTPLRTATLFIKDKTQFVPDIFHAKVPDSQWVIFPWEKSVDNT
jgi:xanthine phosphoribosyltransferase